MVLLAEHVVNPARPGGDVLETWTSAAAIAATTSSIEVMAATKPLLFHPGVLAKQAIQIDVISDGRVAINLVSGWYLPELEQLGLVRAHDDRYAYSREWLDLFRRLVRGERVEHRGPSFTIDGLELRPLPPRPDGPVVYSGGESEPARELAAALSEVYLFHPRPVERARAVIEDLRGRPRGRPEPLRFGTSGFVSRGRRRRRPRPRTPSSRGTRTTARRRRSPRDRPRDAGRAGSPAREPRRRPLAVGRHRRRARRQLRPGGRAPGRVSGGGVELFLLAFQPLEAELERFAAEVAPRARALAAAWA